MENKFTKAIKEFAKKNDITLHQQWEIEWIENLAKDYNKDCDYSFDGAIEQAFDDYHWVIVVGN
jgi:hypothetical protein